MNVIRDHTLVIALAALAAVEAVIAAVFRRQLLAARRRLDRALEAAEDAARAAALAAPDGIDPELVLQLIKSGAHPTLDMVRELMDERDRTQITSQRG